MAWGDLQKNHQLAVLIGVPLVVVAIAGFMSMRALKNLGPDPKLDDVSFLQNKSLKTSQYEKINKIRGEIKDLDAKLQGAPAREQELKKLRSSETILKAQIPSEAEVADTREWLQGIAVKMDKKIGRLRFEGVDITKSDGTGSKAKKGKSSSSIGSIAYRCQLSGDINGFLYYLHMLEANDKRFMRVKDFTVKPGGIVADMATEKPVLADHQFTLNVVTYVYTGDAATSSRGGK